jgi:hypothetical protein
MLPAPNISFSAKSHPKKKFTPAEDALLARVVEQEGTVDWERIARLVPGRNARQGRERWCNYLAPDIHNGPCSIQQEILLVQKQNEFGRAWKRIAAFFPGRTDTAIKSHWLLMQRRMHRTAKQWAALVWVSRRGPKTLEVTSLPLPVGLKPEIMTPFSSDNGSEDESGWNFQEWSSLGSQLIWAAALE